MTFICKFKSIAAGHNAKLFCFTINTIYNNTYFACTNLFIDTQVFFAYDNSPPRPLER